MRRLSALLTILFPVFLATSCTSLAGSVCDAICECEHCNDIEEDELCLLWEAQEEISSVYECESAFEDYATCYEDKGRCEEKEANFSTHASGSCIPNYNSGMTCTDATECYMPDATCDNGTCHHRGCSADGSYCDNDSDCAGDDLCREENQRLMECIDAASDDPMYAFID